MYIFVFSKIIKDIFCDHLMNFKNQCRLNGKIKENQVESLQKFQNLIFMTIFDNILIFN
jgi:hypothetical protein